MAFGELQLDVTRGFPNGSPDCCRLHSDMVAWSTNSWLHTNCAFPRASLKIFFIYCSENIWCNLSHWPCCLEAAVRFGLFVIWKTVHNQLMSLCTYAWKVLTKMSSNSQFGHWLTSHQHVKFDFNLKTLSTVCNLINLETLAPRLTLLCSAMITAMMNTQLNASQLSIWIYCKSKAF